MAIRNEKEYERKSAKLVSLKSEIELLEKQADEYYEEIMRNQDLYIEGYGSSLKVNNSLNREMEKCRAKARKLQEKHRELNYELRNYKPTEESSKHVKGGSDDVLYDKCPSVYKSNHTRQECIEYMKGFLS